MNTRAEHKKIAPSKSAKPAAPVRKAVAKAPATRSRKSTTVAASPSPSPAPTPRAKPAPKPTPKPKQKLVRDSFTIPKIEYVVLESLKLRAANLARPVKKSELLRAGIKALTAMSDRAFLAAVNGVPSLKTGRPSGTGATSSPSTETTE